MDKTKYISPILLIGLTIFLWHRPAVAPTLTFSPPHEGEIERGPREPPITTLIAVGDIMLSRNVSAKIEKAGDPNLPFAKLQETLKSADIAFGNLECPLDPGNFRIREGLTFRCLTKDAEGLFNSGFDVLSTANNHAMDQGLDNLEFTIDYLKSRRILPVGTLPSPDEERVASSEVERPGEVIERNGIKFGFLSYSYSARNDGGKTTNPHIATMDIENLKTQIANLKTVGADVVIVNMHAGVEYSRHPTQEQIDFARAAIDAGADVVLGEHPHWIQDIEIYRDKPILYSLGNFVFDQMWSQETREGLMVKFTFIGSQLKTAKLIPVIIDNYCCPRLANEEEKWKILKKIDLESDTVNFIP